MNDRPLTIDLSKADGQPEIQIHIIRGIAFVGTLHGRKTESDVLVRDDVAFLHIEYAGFCVGEEGIPGLFVSVYPNGLKRFWHVIHDDIAGMVRYYFGHVSLADGRGPIFYELPDEFFVFDVIHIQTYGEPGKRCGWVYDNAGGNLRRWPPEGENDHDRDGNEERNPRQDVPGACAQQGRKESEKDQDRHKEGHPPQPAKSSVSHAARPSCPCGIREK
jgi:hypothetical protein